MTDATAPVYGDATGLVDNQKALVFIDNPLFQAGNTTRGCRSGASTDTRWRNADFVTILEPVICPDATPIHSYLATAQNPVQATARQSRQLAAQKIVQPLAGHIAVNANLAYARLPDALL
jgi:hypothetical protein